MGQGGKDVRGAVGTGIGLEGNLETFALHFEDGKAVLLHEVDQCTNLFKVHVQLYLRNGEIVMSGRSGQEFRVEGPLQKGQDASISPIPTMSVLASILITLLVLVCLLLVLVVLMQLPRSEGLGAAFGGGVTENIFGAQTTHVLAKFTVWLGIAFFALTLSLSVVYAHQATAKSDIQKALMDAPVPAAAAPAVPEGQPSPAASQPAGAQ